MAIDGPATPTTLAIFARQATIVTQTLFKNPPSALPTQQQQRPGSNVPIAAIAGGVAAGALLAVLVSVGWIWWGRAIERAAAKERVEAATRQNTLRNAGGQRGVLKTTGGGGTTTISRPRPQTRYRPMHIHPPPSARGAAEKQVKFVAGPAQQHNDPATTAQSQIGGEKGGREQQQQKLNLGRSPHQHQATPPLTRVKLEPRARHSAAGPSPLRTPPPSSSSAARAAYARGARGPPPLLGELGVDENRGRRFGADVEKGGYEGESEYAAVAALNRGGGGEAEDQHQMRRTPSALLIAAFGRLTPTHSTHANGSGGGGGELTRRSSRWSWTSSLDLRIFGRVTSNAKTNGRVESGVGDDGQKSEVDGASGRFVPMGVAL